MGELSSIPAPSPSLTTTVESLADRYRIHQVPYQNGVHTVDISKRLLKGYYTQEEWSERSVGAKSIPRKVASLPLYHATLAALYRNRDHADTSQKKLVEQLQESFQTDLSFGPKVATSTRIRFISEKRCPQNPPTYDTVSHDFGDYELMEDHQITLLVGCSRWINPSSGLENQMEILLGSRDLTEIEKVYEWVSGVKPYLQRPMVRNMEDDRSAVVSLGFYRTKFFTGDKFIIDCRAYPTDRFYSRGWLVHSQKSRDSIKTEDIC